MRVNALIRYMSEEKKLLEHLSQFLINHTIRELIVVVLEAIDELPSPITSEMVSTIPLRYRKARPQCH